MPTKLLTILGARPQFIKAATVSRAILVPALRRGKAYRAYISLAE